MQKTWKPTTAGVLSIVAGAIDVIIGAVILIAGGIALQFLELTGMEWAMGLIMAIGPIWIVLGIVAIVGGVYALKRRLWGLALAGAICAVSGFWLLGILAIIFVAMGKGEFE